MILLAAWAVAALLAALYWWRFAARGARWAGTITKTGSVAILAWIAREAGAPDLLVIALALGAAGDFFLSRDGQPAFLYGLLAFALAHLSYIALIRGGDGGFWPADARQAMAVWLLLLGAGMLGLLWRRTGPLRVPVAIYLAIIVAMGLAALDHPSWAVPVAAGLFILSDAVLALELFVLAMPRARRIAARVVWPTYWAAQAMFLWAWTGVPVI